MPHMPHFKICSVSCTQSTDLRIISYEIAKRGVKSFNKTTIRLQANRDNGWSEDQQHWRQRKSENGKLITVLCILLALSDFTDTLRP